MFATRKKVTVLILISMLSFIPVIKSRSEICNETQSDGAVRPYACPRLNEEDNKTFCCKHVNFTKLFCCANESMSVHIEEYLKQSKSSWNFTALLIVGLYGILVLSIIIVDGVSHYKLQKNKRNQ